MPEIINIEIIEKHATTLGAPLIVCGNAGYSIQFTFDSEWEGLDPKTARFVYVSNGLTQCEEVEFTGDTVEVPVLINTREVMVGVYADTLCTSTPAIVPCELSIRCLAAVPGANGGGTGGGTGSGGVTDYNDLTNKPITYLPADANLDELVEEGCYLADGFSYGDDGYIDGLGFLIVDNLGVGGVLTQTIICGSSIYYRTLRTNGDIISPMQGGNIRLMQDYIYPLDYTRVEGDTTGYELQTLSYSHIYYSGTINTDCYFALPSVEAGTTEYSICIYAYIPAAVSIDWGTDVLFYDGQVPVIEPGYYDIIFTFDPNAEKWCVGVIRKGAAE